MREKTHQWMQSDAREDIKRLAKWFKRNKKPILVAFCWGISMALITSNAFWTAYLEAPLRFRLGLNISWSLLNVAEHVPRLGSLDYVLLFVISLIAGMIIIDFEVTLFSYITAVIMFLSFASVHAFFFIWFVLGGGSGIEPGFGSTIMFSAVLSVIRLIFPFTIMITFFGGLFGAFLRDLVQPSSG